MERRTFTRQQTDRATAIAIGIMAAVFAIAGIAGYVAGSFDRAAAIAKTAQTAQEPNQ